jgi:hypothetical protein
MQEDQYKTLMNPAQPSSCVPLKLTDPVMASHGRVQITALQEPLQSLSSVSASEDLISYSLQLNRGEMPSDQSTKSDELSWTLTIRIQDTCKALRCKICIGHSAALGRTTVNAGCRSSYRTTDHSSDVLQMWATRPQKPCSSTSTKSPLGHDKNH